MKQLLRFIGALTVIGGALAGVAYYLQKRGTLHIEVNYDDKNGEPVTRDLEEIVDTAVSEASEAVTTRISEITSDVKNTIKKQADAVSKKKDKIVSEIEEIIEEVDDEID